jgi:hypothetical protein
MNKGRIILTPGLWPSSTKHEFEFALYRFGYYETSAAQKDGSLHLRQRPTGQASDSKGEERNGSEPN